MKLVEFLHRLRRPPEVDLATCREIEEWTRSPYHAKFCSWLEAEANRPFVISDQMNLVQAAVRANVLREIRLHLRRTEEFAQDELTRHRKELQDGG